jgi:hypothetical protein
MNLVILSYDTISTVVITYFIDVAGQQTEIRVTHAMLHALCHHVPMGDEQSSMLSLALKILAHTVQAESET